MRPKGASDFTQMQDAEVLYVAVNCKDGNSITTYSKLKFISVLTSNDLENHDLEAHWHILENIASKK